MRLSSALVLGFVQLCISKPLKRWDDFGIKHAWMEVPPGWEYYGDAPADHMLDMRIGLKQDKLDQLISTLYEVSDPAHEKYVPGPIASTTVLLTDGKTALPGMVRTCPRRRWKLS